MAPSFYSLMGAPKPFDPTHRYASSWLLPPYALFALRALFALYAFTTIFFILAWNPTHNDRVGDRHWFSYFTNLTYTGLAFYFLFSSIHTFSYARRGRPFLQSWPRALQALHAIFYTTIVTFPILVTAVFWAILYTGHFATEAEAWANTSQHALNTVWASFEILISRTDPPPPLHLLFLLILLALYLGLAYLTHATQGFYTYAFLDPANGEGSLCAYVFGILAGMIVLFCVVWLVIWLRRWLTEKKLRMEGKFSKHEDTTGGIEMNEKL